MINAILLTLLVVIFIFWWHYRDWYNFSQIADTIMTCTIDTLHYDKIICLSLEDIQVKSMQLANKRITAKQAQLISGLITEYFYKYTTCKVQTNKRGDLIVTGSP